MIRKHLSDGKKSDSIELSYERRQKEGKKKRDNRKNGNKKK